MENTTMFVRVLEWINFSILPIYLVITGLIFKQIPSSLSKTHYLYQRWGQLRLLLREKRLFESAKARGEKYIIKKIEYKAWQFKACIGAYIATLLPVWFEKGDIMNSNFTWLGFLSGISLALVAINAEYLGKDKKRHYLFTAIAAALSILWTICVGKWYIAVMIYAVILSLIGFLYIKQEEKAVWDDTHKCLVYRIKGKMIKVTRESTFTIICGLLWIELAAFHVIEFTLSFIM